MTPDQPGTLAGPTDAEATEVDATASADAALDGAADADADAAADEEGSAGGVWLTIGLFVVFVVGASGCLALQLF